MVDKMILMPLVAVLEYQPNLNNPQTATKLHVANVPLSRAPLYARSSIPSTMQKKGNKTIGCKYGHEEKRIRMQIKQNPFMNSDHCSNQTDASHRLEI